MSNERAVFTERTPWSLWVRAIVWGALLASLYPMLMGDYSVVALPTRLTIVGATVAFVVAIEVLLGGLTVRVEETRIFLHLGIVPLVRRAVPLSAIVSTDSIRYRPIRDFGGWGVSGWGSRKAWSARGDQAVALHLTDDRLLLIGSDHPRRLEERIRAAMGGAKNRRSEGGYAEA